MHLAYVLDNDEVSLKIKEIQTAIVHILTQLYGHVKKSTLSKLRLLICILAYSQTGFFSDFQSQVIRVSAGINNLLDSCIDKHLHTQ